MIASLYQSGSAVADSSSGWARAAAASRTGAVCRFMSGRQSRWYEAPDGVGALVRIQPDMLGLAGPGEAVAGEQVLDRDAGLVVEAEAPERDLEMGALGPVRVQ